jgi:hypothetical protein
MKAIARESDEYEKVESDPEPVHNRYLMRKEEERSLLGLLSVVKAGSCHGEGP